MTKIFHGLNTKIAFLLLEMSSVTPATNMSSKYTTVGGMPVRRFLIIRWKIAGADETPKARRL